MACSFILKIYSFLLSVKIKTFDLIVTMYVVAGKLNAAL